MNIHGSKVLFCFLAILILVSIGQADYIGKTFFQPDHQWQVQSRSNHENRNWDVIIQQEIERGNLVLLRIQQDPIVSMEHRRYKQYYQGIEVFGAQVIQHFRDGQYVGVNGEYYDIQDAEITPLLLKEDAVAMFQAHLGEIGLTERANETEMVLYPVSNEDFRIAYRIILEKGLGYSMTGIIDARKGDVLLEYSNIHYDRHTIGLGIGHHGYNYKFPTTFENGVFYLADLMKVRPIYQYTWHGLWNMIPSDHDNYWDFDGLLVNAHAFSGLTYDYFFLVHGRKGTDDRNRDILTVAHSPFCLPDNAMWSEGWMHFGNPGPMGWRTAAALDIVAHEYSHGVTQYSSGLIYEFQSGALNESFSDIMGTAVEFYFQPPGTGFNKADWVVGEDAFPVYSPQNYIRSLSDPNSRSQSPFGPDPCHLSQVFWNLPFSIDYGGVHLNSTLYSHSYFLLASGGVNKISGIRVTGIGIEKATKIFYRAWVYYLTPTSQFLHAANVIIQSAIDLFGQNSTEVTQAYNSMYAIGWK